MINLNKLLMLIFMSLLISCDNQDVENSPEEDYSVDYFEAGEDHYIVFFLTNTSVDQADSQNTGKDANNTHTFVGELPQLFGDIQKDNPVKYAFGLSGPMLLTQSVSEMQYQVNKAFDIAEKYNVPVYFQLDDINNYTQDYGSDAGTKFYDNPAWCEWVQFPEEGEQWGGQSNSRLPYYWFNWGAWQHAKAFPNLQSPGFRSFVKNRLEDGVLSVLTERYNDLKIKEKGYLFAGMAIGWETHIPDYSSDNPIYNINSNSLPIDKRNGDQMQNWETTKYGYAALNTLGYDTYNKEVLYQVIHDYSELLAKTAYDSGLPREKIFTHIVGIKSSQPNLTSTFTPPIWTAVNDYSTPGFTMSPVTSPYNLDVLKEEIELAEPEQKSFANVEGYSRGIDDSFLQADTYFDNMFSYKARIVAVYGWGRSAANSPYAVSHDPANHFVRAAKKWINIQLKKQ
jgi:hypothetical protein